MKTTSVALLLGVLFVVAGILGFVPGIAPPAPPSAPVVTLDEQYRMILGILPVNVVHDLLHLLFGIWGLLVARNLVQAILYCRVVTWVYAALIVLGLIPVTQTLFGLAPIYGYDIWLHAVLFLIALYGGYGRPSIRSGAV